MKNKYKIGMAARQSGVTPQTVRYYEKEKLFASIKNTDGSTRYYGLRHFKWLSNIRRYFKMGFSEAQVRKLTECASLDEMTALIDKKHDETCRKLAELRGNIAALESFSQQVRYIPVLLDRTVIEENPPMTFLITRRGDEMVYDDHIEKLLENWLENIQFTNLGSIIPLEIMRDSPDSQLRISGHCTLTKNLDLLGCSKEDMALVHFPAARCLHTIVSMSGTDLSPKAIMPHVYHALEERGLEAAGDAFGRSLAILEEQGVATDGQPAVTYYEYWIPVREI